jgi:hypothetical protein
LYIAIGDGGGANDTNDGHGPQGNSQERATPFGSILRIDPQGTNSANGKYGIPPDNPFLDNPASLPEIYAYGFRNPYRISFRNDGRLLVADVGQGEIEELNHVKSGDNAGWRLLEGDYFFDPSGQLVSIPVAPLPDDLLSPVASYDHDDGLAVVGGYDFDPERWPELDGYYLFGDFGTGFGEPSGRLFLLSPDNIIYEPKIGRDNRPLGVWVKGFGRDARGNLYVCGGTRLGPDGAEGHLYRVIPLIDRLQFESHAIPPVATFAADSSLTNLIGQWTTNLTVAASWATAGNVSQIERDRYQYIAPATADREASAIRILAP